MHKALDVTFRGMSPSTSVQETIRQWVDRLEHAYGQIQHCSVVIAQPHQHQRRGKLFHVHVDLTVPGRDIAVSREPARGDDHENVYVAIGDAFRAVRRQLRDHARIRRDQIKRQAA